MDAPYKLDQAWWGHEGNLLSKRTQLKQALINSAAKGGPGEAVTCLTQGSPHCRGYELKHLELLFIPYFFLLFWPHRPTISTR